MNGTARPATPWSTGRFLYCETKTGSLQLQACCNRELCPLCARMFKHSFYPSPACAPAPLVAPDSCILLAAAQCFEDKGPSDALGLGSPGAQGNLERPLAMVISQQERCSGSPGSVFLSHSLFVSFQNRLQRLVAGLGRGMCETGSGLVLPRASSFVALLLLLPGSLASKGLGVLWNSMFGYLP